MTTTQIMEMTDISHLFPIHVEAAMLHAPENDAAIAKVMSRFDFARTREVMMMLNERWQVEGVLVYPSQTLLERTAYDLLQEAAEGQLELERPCSASKGHLMATCEAPGRIKLQFVLCEWNSTFGEEE